MRERRAGREKAPFQSLCVWPLTTKALTALDLPPPSPPSQLIREGGVEGKVNKEMEGKPE